MRPLSQPGFPATAHSGLRPNRYAARKSDFRARIDHPKPINGLRVVRPQTDEHVKLAWSQFLERSQALAMNSASHTVGLTLRRAALIVGFAY